MNSDRLPVIHDRRVVSENPFVRFVEEDIDAAGDGSSSTYYHLEATGDAVIIVPRLADGRYLLERIYRHPCRRWLVEWPAGGIDPGEETLAAAARELLEETGYQAEHLRLAGTINPLAGLVRIAVSVVLAEGCRWVAEPTHADSELLIPFLADRDELDYLAAEEGISGILLFGMHYLERSGAE